MRVKGAILEKMGLAVLVSLSLGGVGAALVAGGCGASVSSIYEGDVRFEHCMALDARPAVTRPQRRQCWIEWVRYYTYGQTQDRVEYAVAHASGSERAAKESESAPILAAPEPTSAFAPPPMMLEPGNAGGAAPPPPLSAPSARPAAPSAPRPVPPAPDATPPTDTPAPPPVDPGCQADCAEARADCRTTCQGGSCEKSCSGKYARCLERCAEVRGR